LWLAQITSALQNIGLGAVEIAELEKLHWENR
jgi:hypothetical protein